ncbi:MULTISPECIES: helix-turn-helix domain-containing protein [Streptomyces]|nr:MULTISPECIES: helix-turn-helix transcriptional regulator [Streptomyces]GHF19205.1 hypothetical protein GCM10010359_21130 [Streptomyces morookaense]
MIGDLIRDLRKAQGWSQGRLATELNRSSGANLTREYVSGWERGKVRPGPFYLRHLAVALGVPLSVLEGTGPGRGPSGVPDGLVAKVAPAVADDLLSRGFAVRLRGGPPLEEWEARLTRHGVDYLVLGAAEMQRRLADDLVVVQQQLDEPRMWAVAALLMTMYATTFSQAEEARAASWYRSAAEAADRSGDRAIRVWVRGRAVLSLGYWGTSLGLADMFADQALALGGQPSPGLVAANLSKACSAAIHGERTEALRLADDARRTFEAAEASGSPRPFSISGKVSDFDIPAWRVNGFLSLLSTRLGDEKRADHAYDETQRELPPQLLRFATHMELHRGLVLARAGDVAGGLAYAQAALDALPPGNSTDLLQLLIAEIRSQSPDRTPDEWAA